MMRIILLIFLALASATPLEKLAQQVASIRPEQGLLEEATDTSIASCPHGDTPIPADGQDHSVGCNAWCRCDGNPPALSCHATGCGLLGCPPGSSLVTIPSPTDCCGQSFCVTPTNRNNGDPCIADSQCKSGLLCVAQPGGGKKCSACVFEGVVIPDNGQDQSVGCNQWCRCTGTNLACRATGCPVLNCGVGQRLVTSPPTPTNCCGASSCVEATDLDIGERCTTNAQCKSRFRCLAQPNGVKKCSACVFNGAAIPDDGQKHSVGCNQWCTCSALNLACFATGCPLLACPAGQHVVTGPPTSTNCCGVSSCQSD